MPVRLPPVSTLDVLVVDDDSVNLNLITAMLSHFGVRSCAGIQNATQAVALLRRQPERFGLVLCDWNMPKISGLDLLEILRAGGNGVPFMMMTVRGDPESIVAAKRRGVSAYLVKPVGVAYLREKLAQVVDLGRPACKRAVPRIIESSPMPPDPDAWIGPEQGEGNSPPSPSATREHVRETPDVAASVSTASRPVSRGAGTRRPAIPTSARQSVGIHGGGIEAATTETPTRKYSDDEWREALASVRAPKVGRDAPALNLPQILEDHGRWLHTKGADGRRANMEKLDLRSADLTGANLRNATCEGVDLSDARMAGVHLEGVDLRRSELAGADLRDAALGVAKLRHAILDFADLQDAVLRGADLAGARFRGARLEGADLTGANLLETDFRETDLSGVKGLVQAQISRIRFNVKTRLPLGLRFPRVDPD